MKISVECVVCGKNFESNSESEHPSGLGYHFPTCSPGTLKTWAATTAFNKARGKTAKEIREMYRHDLKAFEDRSAARDAARSRGDVSATFWHNGRVFSGSATPQPGGLWNFVGTQSRQFAGRGFFRLNVTGMVRFNPRYNGKHTVEETGGMANERWISA